jgi:hypothetical protein
MTGGDLAFQGQDYIPFAGSPQTNIYPKILPLEYDSTGGNLGPVGNHMFWSSSWLPLRILAHLVTQV